MFNPFPHRATKSEHFAILLCLTPDDFTRQRRASGWGRVNIYRYLECWKKTGETGKHSFNVSFRLSRACIKDQIPYHDWARCLIFCTIQQHTCMLVFPTYFYKLLILVKRLKVLWVNYVPRQPACLHRLVITTSTHRIYGQSKRGYFIISETYLIFLDVF